MRCAIIPGFDDRYRIYEDGTVESCVNGQWGKRDIWKKRKHHMHPDGYPAIILCRADGSPKNLLVHRLVAQAFIPNPENKPCINHIDENRKNYALDNLEWCSYLENTRAWTSLHGKYQGEKCARAKLNNADVVAIRSLHYLHGYSQGELVRMYKCWTVRDILHGKCWTHV